MTDDQRIEAATARIIQHTQGMAEWDGSTEGSAEYVSDLLRRLVEETREECVHHRRTPMTETCRWVLDDAYECWEASCGEAWCMLEGTPEENSYRFCPGCGKPVETVYPEPEPEEEEDG